MPSALLAGCLATRRFRAITKEYALCSSLGPSLPAFFHTATVLSAQVGDTLGNGIAICITVDASTIYANLRKKSALENTRNGYK